MGNLFGAIEKSSSSDMSAPLSSSIPERVLWELRTGLDKGFKDDKLELSNEFINDNNMADLCEWIIKLDGKISTLLFHHNNFGSRGACTLFDALKNCNSTISTLGIQINQIDIECILHFGEYLKANKSIRTINIGHDGITDHDVVVLATYLDGNKTIKTLGITTFQGITDASIPTFTKIIESTQIADINILGTPISKRNALAVPIAFNKLKYGCDRFVISLRDVTDEDMINICIGIKEYGTASLKAIVFEGNLITSIGAIALFDALKESNAKVEELELHRNKLSDECMDSLGEYLQSAQTVKHLGLGGNKLTNFGVEILSSYIIGDVTLKALWLYRNRKLTSLASQCLKDVAQKSYVTDISLYQTKVSLLDQAEITKLLKIPTKERDIPIKSNTKSAAKSSNYIVSM